MDKAAWPASSVESWPIGRVIPFARNARTHSDAQVAQIAGSLREWGWTNPLLVDEDGTLIAGHGRLLAARQLGIESVPVMVARGWSKVQRDAYVIADNKLALNASWNDEQLFSELVALNGTGFDLNVIGFSQEEFDAMMTGPGDGPPGDVEATPEPPEIPISEPGDMWVLGDHRLLCGDSTDALAVAAVLQDERPHLMVTDPPYGVEYDADWRNKAIRTDGTKVGGRAVGKVENDDRVDWAEAWALFPGDVAYVWCDARKLHVVSYSIERCGFELRSQIVWAKNNFAIGRGDYHWKHEPCLYAVRKGATGHWQGARDQTTLWEIDKPTRSETGHSTQKPVDCMSRPLLNNSEVGDAVYEPFSGSGTTIIAAEWLKRRCFAIEINPAYVDVAVERWQTFTGKAAVLYGDGRSFSEVRDERQAIGVPQ